ncbi:MAG TPA: nucleotidyltransferase domain-containing protein [Bacteroides sp.]|nr:nucleotidyltransferase domain-containing protein [Bacteroides sp.]
MRLSNTQKEIIEKTAIRHFGKDVRVYLFGSRVYPEQKGGDIDLFLERVPEELITIKKKIAFIIDLKKNLGDQKIDVVFKTRKIPRSKFQQIIEKTKIPIC